MMRRILTAAALAVCALWTCAAEAQDAESVKWMNRGVGLMEQYRFADAVKAFQKTVERAPEWPYAWMNLGVAQLNAASDPEAADALNLAHAAFLKADALNPKMPHPQYALAVLARYRGDNDAALRHFNETLNRDPNSADSLYFVGAILLTRGDYEQAEAKLRQAVQINPYLLSARYSLGQALVRLNRRDEALKEMALFRKLDEANAGVKRAVAYGEMGVYADVVRIYPLPEENAADPPINVRFMRKQLNLPVNVNENAFALVDLNQDGRIDIYLPNAGVVCVSSEAGYAETVPIGAKGCLNGVFGDMDDDGDVDLFAFGNGQNRLLRNEGGNRFVDAPSEIHNIKDAVHTAAWTDADHEGDLDLIAAGAGTLAVYRNNGNGAFQKIEEKNGSPFPMDAPFALGDADGDMDVDLIVLPKRSSPRLYRNDRLNRWTDISAQTGLAEMKPGGAPVAGDFDGDGRVDLLLLYPSGAELLLNRDGRFERLQFSDPPRAHSAVPFDADNDGDIDIVFAEKNRLRLYENDGSGAFQDESERFGLNITANLRGPIAAADIDADGDSDLLAINENGELICFQNEGGNANRWLHIALEGERANRSGYGAQVEIRSGGMRRQMERHMIGGAFMTSNPHLEFGLGQREGADYLRILWPNGVLQSELELPANQFRRVKEVQRKASSCPILFAWNGARYEFITDFLGVGGLGFFLAPGVYAQPDPTERVKLEAGQLEPLNGEYLFQIMEPMEEAVYLDAVELIAVDHPVGTEAYPDERFAADGNLPMEQFYVFAKRHYPRSAVDGEGRDLLPALTTRDRVYQPLKRHRRHLGFLEQEASIHLQFSDEAVQMKTSEPPKIPVFTGMTRGGGERLVLFIFGWVEYPYSHINYAAAQEGLTLEGMSVDARDAEGEWRAAAPSAGYPAGMPKMMTLELPNLQPNEWRELRLRMNQEIYIDELFIAAASTRPAALHRVEASRAVLRRAGYPREYSPDGRMPRLYDYDSIDPSFPFKNMRGVHTRFGDVLPLLTEVDDQFVIMGRGDGLELAFPADKLPPVPSGSVRSYILDTHGYCKDMDLYTAHPMTVGPLPFKAMPSYPYPADVSYPETEKSRAFFKKYQTRIK